MNASQSELLQPLLIPAKKRKRSSLILGLFLLPQARRKDAFLFHDFCRHLDDITDILGNTMDYKRCFLNTWMKALNTQYGNLLPENFRTMIDRHNLEWHLLRDIVRGMLMDTEYMRYESFSELYHYCYRVASTVGLVFARIFGGSGANIDHYAKNLGIAMQLTNIIRDVAEDASMGRIYIPAEDMHRFRTHENEILESRFSSSVEKLLTYQAQRAELWFIRSEVSWSLLNSKQKHLMRPALFMGTIYREILFQMHQDRYHVFTKRYCLPIYRKLLLLLRMITEL